MSSRPEVGVDVRGAAPTDDRVRIGDVERERAVTDLGEHFAAGRLTADELDERLELAWRARTAADLRPLFHDLPHAEFAVRAADRSVVAPRRGAWAGTPLGLPIPLLLLLAVVLSVVAHAPIVLMVLLWLIIGRFRRGGRSGASWRWHAVRR